MRTHDYNFEMAMMDQFFEMDPDIVGRDKEETRE